MPQEKGKVTSWKEEYDQFKSEFSKETDRAAVILAAAKIHELLRLAIIKRLTPSPTMLDDLCYCVLDRTKLTD